MKQGQEFRAQGIFDSPHSGKPTLPTEVFCFVLFFREGCLGRDWKMRSSAVREGGVG